MHEYSIAVQIAGIAEEQSDNKPLKEISIGIGTLSGVFDESLKFYLEHIFHEKYNSGIEIRTEIITAEFKCSCGEKYTTDNILSPCPNCGKFERTIIKGNECIIKSIKTE